MVAPPPLVLCSEPGSFARATLAVRVPAILQRTIEAGHFEAAARDRLAALHDELVNGRVRALVEDAPDRAVWDEDCAPHLGRPWLDLPFYFAEAFCYRRVAEAVRWRELRVDPFLPMKRAEEAPDQAPARVEAALAVAASSSSTTRALLLASLWGNRVDLSLSGGLAAGAAHDARASDAALVVDDTDVVLARIADGLGDVVVWVDNAATELAMDLALVDDLLHGRGAARVTLIVKDAPTFVSDAIVKDVDRLLDVVEDAGGPRGAAMVQRLRGARDRGAFVVVEHPFTTTARPLDRMPDDLRGLCGTASLVVVKGDAQYRRLCHDARWPETTPFEDVVADVPGPLVALRTCKAEVIVGLPAGLRERLDQAEPGWLVQGRRGLVQARLQPREA